MKDFSHGTPCAVKAARTVWVGAKDSKESDLSTLLLSGELGAWSVEIWRRFRKWGGIPTGITQNVKSLLNSKEIESIFENSDFIYMLSQAPGDREILADKLNISPKQLSYVTQSEPGEGLIFFGNVILPFVDKFPKESMLYNLISTRLKESVD